MTTKLKVYNSALMICGEERITALTDARKSRRLLDDVWDNGAVDACLARAQWIFAMRAVKIDYDTAITPDFGYAYAFTKPSDWVITSALCSDEYFRVPLNLYVDEVQNWYCDEQIIYVKYVSNDAAYGGDPSIWPDTFSDYVSAHMARKIIMNLSSDENKRSEINQYEKDRLKEAKSNNAMAGPQKFAASGNFVNSRGGRSNRDRGNRGSLIG